MFINLKSCIMKIKKNPSADPKRNSSIYLQLGLMFVLVLTFIGIEYKTANSLFIPNASIDTESAYKEEIALITLPPTQSLPVVTTPIITDDVEVVRDEVILNNEPIDIAPMDVDNLNSLVSPIVAASSVGSSNIDNGVDEFPEVDFRVVEQIPLFPGCENVPKEEQMNCFNAELQKHIKKNFRYPDRAIQDNLQGRVSVQFIIEKDGSITVTNVRGPKGGELLEKEGVRNINKLPKLKPGMQRGKPVKVRYAVPINFKLQ